MEHTETHSEKYDQVWGQFFPAHRTFISQHRDRIWPDYEAYLDQLAWKPDRYPDLAQIETSLAETGWTVTPIEGFESSRTIFENLAGRRLPIARNIRAREHLNYSPQPDSIHDLVGHVPFVFFRPLMDLTQAIASKAVALEPSETDRALYHANSRLSTLKASPASRPAAIQEAQSYVDEFTRHSLAEPSAFALASRLYLWAIEFGLLEFQGEARAIGAGLLSSHADLTSVLCNRIPVRPFSDEVLFHEVAISGPQAAVYRIADLDEVHAVLERIGT